MLSQGWSRTPAARAINNVDRLDPLAVQGLLIPASRAAYRRLHEEYLHLLQGDERVAGASRTGAPDRRTGWPSKWSVHRSCLCDRVWVTALRLGGTADQKAKTGTAASGERCGTIPRTGLIDAWLLVDGLRAGYTTDDYVISEAIARDPLERAHPGCAGRARSRRRASRASRSKIPPGGPTCTWWKCWDRD